MYENEEAKSCPFCGFVGVDICQGTTFRWRYAQCNGCEARAGEVRIQTSGSGTREEWEQEARIQAIKEWNTRTEANPWRYVGRDGNPKESGKYLAAWVYGGTGKCGVAVIEFYPRSEWSLYARDYKVYAWRTLPEAPPLEPEGGDE